MGKAWAAVGLLHTLSQVNGARIIFADRVKAFDTTSRIVGAAEVLDTQENEIGLLLL